MRRDKRAYRFLIIEDNPGDFTLIEDFLEEQILAPELIHVQTCEAALTYLSQPQNQVDVVLLDLSLPDKQGTELISQVLAHSTGIPVIVLTGHSDIDFGIKSLALGISDYLLKDDLSAVSLYKSILYSLERHKHTLNLEASEKRYSDLFHLSPQPMWVFDVATERFLNVNQAAIQHYGYSLQEFQALTLRDIRPAEDLPLLAQELQRLSQEPLMLNHGVFRHRKKNGEIIQVELKTSHINYQGRPARLVLANDVTERFQYVQAIEAQNENFREITWMQSHVVRAPLARIMGLVQLIEMDYPTQERPQHLQEILNSAHELDGIIQEIVKKAEAAHALVQPPH